MTKHVFRCGNIRDRDSSPSVTHTNHAVDDHDDVPTHTVRLLLSAWLIVAADSDC